ncbi:hypothetical protein ACA910_000743 [Epithemia clementina (nom. ined.)]
MQQQGQQIQKRWHSSSPASTGSSSRSDKLRVAVVGGGCAGLATALHLAPLVEEGYIASPIDIFDANDSDKIGRDIGIGVWTTALDPFLYSPRDSHQTLYQELTQTRISTWLDYVGYRTPKGEWLMLSKLPHDWVNHMGRRFPGLLFMRERDLLNTLQKAVLWEQQLGTLKLHRSAHSKVVGVAHDEWWSRGQMQHPWSAKLELKMSATSTQQTERDYHLIVAADGTWSNLRSKYGGHDGFSSASSTLPGSSMVGGPSMDDAAFVSSSSSSSSSSSRRSSRSPGSMSEAGHQEAIGLQDRNYTVFRGNAPITTDELNSLDPDARFDENHRVSFQTWGAGKSMRFATVPLICPPSVSSEADSTTTVKTTGDSSDGSEKKKKKYQEHQVWFVTINDEQIDQEPDPQKRVDMLLEHFKDWHAPIHEIVRATDPNSILMERAIAHRHCMGPVTNLNRILQKQYRKDEADAAAASSTDPSNKKSMTTTTSRPDLPYAGGPGPVIVFMGDAYMTIDPILAQGFTLAMEGSANLHECLRRALSSPDSAPPPPLAFDPYVLRDELKIRHEARMERLICLLRATELVQALGQPQGGSMLGWLNTHVLRPLTLAAPRPIKRSLFDRILKYSLGLSS